MGMQITRTPLAVRNRRTQELAAMRMALRSDRASREDDMWNVISRRVASDLIGIREDAVSIATQPEPALVITRGQRDVVARVGPAASASAAE